ncbi:MAG TPA: phage holin family protein [Methanosarcinales archaeon]|nr:phage holin family protein [Methanosarcinales archaeon]
MKLYLSSITTALVLFFAPIKGIILMVALATIIDTCFGLWKAKKLEEEITSKLFRNGLVPKLVSYVAAVMLIYASDVFIINALTMSVISVEFISTKLIALVLLSIEVKSMDESFVKVKGYSFIDKTKVIINKIKDLKKQF